MTPEEYYNKKLQYMREYHQRPEIKEQYRIYHKEYMKEYRKRPGVMERHRIYMNSYTKLEKSKSYQNEYAKQRRKDPEHKKYMAEYQRNWIKLPQNKLHRQEYDKAYKLRPEVIERKRQEQIKKYGDTYRHRPNYPKEAWCAGCKLSFKKPIRICKLCRTLLRQGPTRKKDVFRY